MRAGLRQQKLAADCGHWPLYRYRPAADSRHPEFLLDSPAPKIPVGAYAYNEVRYKMLTRTDPARAERLLAEAQLDINERWDLYKDLAERWPPNGART
jgi:pyruvate-ferredoxin/flavodoxin oxidoreductase